MKKINQLKAGAILSYISLGLTSFISILYTPIMIKLLGQSEYGLYNLANSVIGYLGVLDFGLGVSVIRYTAKYRALNDKEGEENLHGMFIIIYSILAIILLIVGGIIVANCSVFFSNSLTANELNRIKILMGVMIFNLAISFPFSVFGGIITAYEHFIFPKVIAIVRAILNPFVMIPLLFLGYKSIGMTIGTTIINLLCIGVNLFYCFKVLKIRIKFKKFDFKVLKEVSVYSYFIFLNIIVDKIYWATDQFILGSVSGTVAVAIYSVGSQMNTYYMSFSNAISGVFLPKVTKMVTNNVDDNILSNLFVRTGRIQYIIMSFILSGFILFGYDFIKIWAGEEYGLAYFIALVVMIPLTVPLIQNLGVSILQAKNIHRFRSNVYIAIAIINVIVSIPLAKMFGGIGAAWSTAISMIIGNVVIINIYYYKKVHIDIKAFWINILKMSVPVLFSLAIGIVINRVINIGGYIGIGIKGSIFSLIFFMLMWIMGMNEYEKNLFSRPFKILKNKLK